MVYGICALFGTYMAHTWQTKICSNILKGKNMGITVSFIFCLLSGLFAFWLFWKCVDWFEKI